jgi:hypothetical protein
MKKIQTIDFDLKDNIIKNLKQLLKKLLVENIDIFYVKKLNQNNQDILYIIKKIFVEKITIMNSTKKDGIKNIEV